MKNYSLLAGLVGGLVIVFWPIALALIIGVGLIMTWSQDKNINN